jgi:hypothetical protein
MKAKEGVRVCATHVASPARLSHPLSQIRIPLQLPSYVLLSPARFVSSSGTRSTWCSSCRVMRRQISWRSCIRTYGCCDIPGYFELFSYCLLFPYDSSRVALARIFLVCVAFLTRSSDATVHLEPSSEVGQHRRRHSICRWTRSHVVGSCPSHLLLPDGLH